MSKLKEFKESAMKVGQAVVATTMLTTGVLGIGPDESLKQPTPKQPTETVAAAQTATKPATKSNEPVVKEMLWLDEDHLIINGEILSNEEAYAKYPQAAPMLERFAEACLREKERELNPDDELPQDGWETLPPEVMQEVERRMQNFDINDYLPKETVDYMPNDKETVDYMPKGNKDVNPLKNWIGKPLEEPTMER